jgi:hypothetical protein
MARLKYIIFCIPVQDSGRTPPAPLPATTGTIALPGLAIDPTFAQIGADATHVKLLEGETPAELLPLVDIVGKVTARVIAYGAGD